MNANTVTETNTVMTMTTRAKTIMISLMIILWHILHTSASIPWRCVGLVVRRPPRERKVPGSKPDCAGIFSRLSHTSDLNIGTPVATLPGAWRYRISPGTGRPGVSIL